ncbi:S9 family peptidase [Sphingomonas cavernae]|uniref:Acyl-peptide hydrolase n=2 Tax=Sphingomonas cavernae TaxID=2320861 RepID=A0A418WKT2_9SPHN|nr:S9 family peptidase [Sphingomonas cavernae]
MLAQPAAADDRDALAAALALPVASGLAGARDVPRFAWIESAAGVRNIWTADPGAPARKLSAYSADDGQQLYDLTFSNSGAHLAFVAGGDGEFPDDDRPNTGPAAEVPAQQVFVVAWDAGAPSLVGEGHSPAFDPRGERLAYTRKGEVWMWHRGAESRKLATVTGDVTGLQWSPDGSRLLFVDNRDDHSFVAVLDIASARLTYLDPGLGYSVEPIFSPDGRQVAFVRYVDPPQGASDDTGPYWSIRIADAASGAARELWAAPPGKGGRYYGTRSRNLFWSSRGEILFPWERSGWVHAYAIDASKGGTPRALTQDAFEVESFLLDATGRNLIYASNAGDIDRRHVWRQRLDGGVPEALTHGDGIESNPTIAGDALAVIASDARRPAHPALVARALQPLGKVVEAQGFIAPEAVMFTAEDGVEVHGQLFRGRANGKRPAIVFVHGGPRRQMLLGFHPSGYYSKTYAMNQYLASQGYTVLSVNYRSGTGYGQAFRDARDTGRGGASEYRDVLAAGRWLAGQSDVDPDRIGIWGGSWGGYLTALALARDSALFAAGVDLHGVHTLLRTVPGNLSPKAQEAARQLQWDSSPMAALDRWKSPVLLIHGDDDKNVAFWQSLLLARELAARRIPFEELTFPNERHSFFRHDSWLRSMDATRAFFDENLKGEPK